MILSGKLNRRVGLYRLPADTLIPALLAETWVSLRAKPDEFTPTGIQSAPAQAGLRHPIVMEIRMRYRDDLQHGDYAVWNGRLFHLVSLRDPDGREHEIIASAHELAGITVGYIPAYTGSPAPDEISARAFMRRDAPYFGGIGQVVDYRTQFDLSIFETGRATRGAQIILNNHVWTVQTLVSDDGVVRTVWATP